MNNTGNRYNDNLFRLAAMLYKDDKYNLNRSNIIRKIIESIFLEDNRMKSIIEIIDICKTNYNLIFTVDEVKRIIFDNRDNFIINNEKDDLKTCLTERRIKGLKTHEGLWIGNYIEYFLEKTGYDDKDEGKEILYKFLHEIFTTNLKNYQYFLNKTNIDGEFSINLKNYNHKEKKLINDFLNFDDKGKDNAIFDIVSLSLEYCILTGNSKQVYVQGIRNKVFYLDSNIIYRAIGINGETRKQLTISFLEKCKNNNIEIAIFKYSDQEFKDSIKYHLKNIYEYKHKRIHSEVYRQYNNRNDDIYTFYYDWCSGGRINKDQSYFEAYIYSLYDDFLNKFNIRIDYTDYFENDDKELYNIMSTITKYKEEDVSDIIIENDAKNILALKNLRYKKGDLNKKLLETKYYMISTDQALREWDYKENKNQTPLILLPSHWMAIMLRYVGRTSDDYKSFVSFLNLRYNENFLDGPKLHAILSGISELTEDLSCQKRYAAQIIELRSRDIISIENYNEIYEETQKFVKEDLESTVKNLQNEINDVKEQLSVTREDMEKNYISKKIYNEEMNKVENERDLYKKQLIDKEIKEELNKWRRTGYLALFLLLIVLAWILLHFFWKDSKYNPIYRFVIPHFEGLPEISRNLILVFDVGICWSLPCICIKVLYDRLYKKSKKYINKEKELRQEKINIFG